MFCPYWVAPTILGSNTQCITANKWNKCLAPLLALLTFSWWKWGTNSHITSAWKRKLIFPPGLANTSKGEGWLIQTMLLPQGQGRSLLPPMDPSDTRKAKGRKQSANYSHLLQPQWCYVGVEAQLTAGSHWHYLTGEWEHHLLLPGRGWKTMSLLSLINTLSVGESEHALVSLGWGRKISCPEQPACFTQQGSYRAACFYQARHGR